MFQEVNYELQETDNVQGQIYKHVFAPNGGFWVYHPSNIFVMYRTKIEQNIYKQLYLFTAFLFTVPSSATTEEISPNMK